MAIVASVHLIAHFFKPLPSSLTRSPYPFTFVGIDRVGVGYHSCVKPIETFPSYEHTGFSRTALSKSVELEVPSRGASFDI